jgi:hypothetical protein
VSVPVAEDRLPLLPEEDALVKAFNAVLEKLRPVFSSGR